MSKKNTGREKRQVERFVKRLYRFYNFDEEKYGEPFALCDNCKKDYKPPLNVYIEKIADATELKCNICGV